MIDKLKIDGTDAYIAYKIIIGDESYESIIAPPRMREPDKNEWAEENGIEVDLENPIPEGKEISINFISLPGGNIGAFIEMLTTGAYHVFNFMEIGQTKTLRLKSMSDYSGQISMLRTFSLQFIEDNPMDGYIYQAPINGLGTDTGYAIDGVDLASYGAMVLEGTEEEMRKAPETKSNLIQTNRITPGVQYDAATVKFKEKEVQIKMLIQANSPAEAIRNYMALIYNLIRPGLRTLSELEDYYFYYTGGSVAKLAIKPKAWLEFSITITLTQQVPKDETTIGTVAGDTFDITFN